MLALVLACALAAPLAWGQSLPLDVITPLPYEYTDTAQFPPESGPVSNTTNYAHLVGFPGLVTRLNALDCPEAAGLTLEQVLEQIVGAPDLSPGCSSYYSLAGAYWNHALYFAIMAPFGSQTFEADASEALKNALLAKFNSYEGMLQAVNTTAASRFGPGWLWMCITPDGELDMITTTLHENPLSPLIVEETCTPFLGLDIWEHAYFLTYLVNRVQYTIDWFQVVNWAKVSEFYELALAGTPPPVVYYEEN